MMPRLLITALAILIFLVVVLLIPDAPRVPNRVTSENLITRADYDVSVGWQ